MEYRAVRYIVKTWVALLLVLFIAGPLVLVMGTRLRAAPYQRDFKGMREADVVALIGKPRRDERDGRTPADFTLSWSYTFGPFGSQLILEFKDGVVVDQYRGSR